MLQSSAQKKVYCFDSTVELSLGKVNISVSKYLNALVVIINQIGTVGAMLEGKLEGTGEEDIFDIKVLFGATDNPFYEILLRRVLQVVHSACRADPTNPLIVSMFASLPIKHKQFSDKQYYSKLVEILTKDLPTLFQR